MDNEVDGWMNLSKLMFDAVGGAAGWRFLLRRRPRQKLPPGEDLLSDTDIQARISDDQSVTLCHLLTSAFCQTLI